MVSKVASAQPTGGASPNKAKRTPRALPLLPNLDAFPETGRSRWRDIEPFVRYSREWARQHEMAGRFPKRQHMGRTALWENSEIKRWLADPVNYRAEA
ncbi:helix-turn-helix transcriptional regulator [Paraburkholderia polaris]|uniref:helix-turn-helix transcriptional regulator n=1 Tax=Paraburkholderia polaris TaxID=2728848 RepID=UPI0019804F99|nr:transcriptional regulator [Paraburkholderia polaris]